MVLLPKEVVITRWSLGRVLAVVVVCSLTLVPRFGQSATDHIVAVVEAGIVSEKPVKSQIITASEVDEMVRPLLAKMSQSGERVDVDRVRKKVLDELILRVLREQKAEQMGVVVEEKDLDAVMTQIEHNNRLPPGSLPEALAKQGIDFKQYRQGLRDQLMKSRLINKVIRPLVSVSADEVQNLYQASRGVNAPQEVRLGQILLSVDATANASRIEEKSRLAEKLIQQLREGASLASLAGQYSDDPSGLDGGEIGWFKRGELLPEMEEVVFGLAKGEIAKPVRTSQGIHILVVQDRRQAAAKGHSEQPKVKVKGRHILIKVPPGPSSEDELKAHEIILNIRKELMAGADFEKMARKFSQDETAKEGGDLKWFGPGMMVAPFEQAAFGLEPKQISEPVRTPFGWHLILVEEKKVLAPDSLEAQSKELEERVMEAKLQGRYTQWLRDIRLRAFVEYR